MNGPPPGAAPRNQDRSRPKRSLRFLLPLTVGLVLIAGVAAGVWCFPWPSHSGMATYTVRYERVQPVIVARGEVEAADYSNIVCRVRSLTQGGYSTAINWIIDNGARVRRGELLARLD